MTYDTPQWIKDDLKKKRREKMIQKVTRNKFLLNLKQAAEDNPVVVLAVAASVLAASAQLIRAHGQAQGSRAYAKQVNYRINKNK